VLAAVLKLYFRQLPEPLVPPTEIPKFLAVARARIADFDNPACEAEAAEAIRELLAALPESNRSTLAFTMAHLKRVSMHAEENKMKPSNIVRVAPRDIVSSCPAL